MLLAVSNLAWPREADAAAATILKRLGVPGIEVAPTKIWPQPLTVPDGDVAAYREFWNSRGIRIVAMQSLLFGRPELQLFGDTISQVALLAHLGGMCRLAALLGAEVLVFGSPKNRRRGQLTHEAATTKAYDLFCRLGDIAAQHHVLIGIEANPAEYQCDFLTTGVEAAQFVQRMAHPAIVLHLDTACLALSGESPGPLLRSHGQFVRHIHISEPQLRPIHTGTLLHGDLAKQIVLAGYSKWISIEMQEPDGPFDERCFEESVAFVQRHYFAGRSARAA